MTIDTEYFKNKLEIEKARLEKELSTLGVKNVDNKTDWEATPNDISEDKSADPNEHADHFEEFETRASIMNEIEAEYDLVIKALKKIEDGTYGICEVSGEPIEKERLEANPSARTCMAHM